MKVSIITVCFNSASTIADTIKSVIDQDHTDIEYIIIDGGSTDGTAEIVRSFGNHIHIFISERDAGIYEAINKGIGKATGSIISILNSDDYYASSIVLSLINKQLTNGNIDAAYGDLIYVDRMNTNRTIRKWKAGNYSDGDFLSGWMPPHPAFFVKREVYEKYGLFNSVLRYAADYELMLRFIHKHKISLSYIPEVLVKMRTGGFGNTSFMAKVRANIEDRRAWTMNNLEPNLLTLWLKPLSKLRQFIS